MTKCVKTFITMFWKSLTNASHFSVNPEKDLRTKNGLQVAWGTAFRRSTFCIKKQLKSPSEKNRMDYKLYKNILSTCLKDAENSYYINLVHEKQSGTTKFWKAYGATPNPNKRKQQTKLQKLIVDGKTLTDDKDIADGINNYFCTIGSKISSKIKSPGRHFTDHLKNKINNTFFISPVVEAEVSRVLAKLNKKSFWTDNITWSLLKSWRHVLHNFQLHSLAFITEV